MARTDDPQVLITPAVIARLRERHISLYRGRLAGGSPAVRVWETTQLLELWRGMEGKSWLVLSEREEGEVVDALSDEGWEFQCDGDGEVLFVREPDGVAKGG